MKRNLRKMNTTQLRKMAVALGAEESKLHGTSKEALIIIIHQLEK